MTVPITVGADAGAATRRARSLVEGALDGREYTERFAPVVEELINRCGAVDIEVYTDQRDETTVVGMRAGNWMLDVEAAGRTPTAVRVRFPAAPELGGTGGLDDVRAVLIALLPDVPWFAESLAAEAADLGTGELTIAVTGEPGRRTVEFTLGGIQPTRIVRPEPATDPEGTVSPGSGPLDVTARLLQ